MKIEERFNRVLAGLSHTGYTTEIEKCEARIFIEELYKQNQKYKEVIDKAIEYISELDDNTDDTTCYDIDKDTRDYILSILKEVE